MIKPNTASIRVLMDMVDNDWFLISSADFKAQFVTRKGVRIESTTEQKAVFGQMRGNLYEYTTGMTGLESEKIKTLPFKLAWYETCSEINDKGRELVEENRAKIVAALAKKAEKDKTAERLVIFQRWDTRWGKHAFGRHTQFDGLFRVTRETAKCLYGEVVLPTKEDYFWYIRDNRGKPHLERAQVIIDNATPEMFKKLHKMEQEKFADMKALENRMQAEMNEVERRYQNSLKQSDAMYADLMVEAGLDRTLVDGKLAATNTFSKIHDPKDED